jgi:oligopeptide transport system substrate-binding protein
MAYRALATVMRFICLCLLLLLSSCGSDVVPTVPRSNDTIIRLSESEARGLDPQIASDLSSIRMAADQFEGLTRFNAGGMAVAGLAERWQISPDGRIWTFTLRPNLQFSDETKIEGGIFVKALARIRNEKTGSPHTSLFAVIQSIDTPNADVVIVRLNNPFPQLPALLAHPAMAALPFHLIEAKGDAWTAARPLVTSGPYRLTNWRLNQQMTLSANPAWHGGKPEAHTVIWQPMDNVQSGMRLMLAGGADISTEFPANRTQWLRQRYPKLVHGTGFLATYYFAFNTRRPPFDDARVRRALSMAVDRKWMAEKMIAAGNEPAWGLLPPGLGGDSFRSSKAMRPVWSEWPKAKRLADARSLLTQAGYGKGRPLRLEIRLNSSAEHRRAAAAMATMWREIGVEASLLNSEASLHFDSLKRGDFELARSGWVADLPAPENFLAVHRSDAGAQNYSGYANPAYDKALDDALADPDPARRAVKMRAAEAILIGDAPILPLYFYVSRALVQPDVTGWQDNIGNIHPSYTLAKGRK